MPIPGKTPEPGRLQFLTQMLFPPSDMDDYARAALAIYRERITPERLAFLLIEAADPHNELTVAEQAKRDGVSKRTAERRQ